MLVEVRLAVVVLQQAPESLLADYLGCWKFQCGWCFARRFGQRQIVKRLVRPFLVVISQIIVA